MFDLGHLPNKDTGIVQEFFGPFGTTPMIFSYPLPKNKSFVYIFLGGPGGNGGIGFANATTNSARSGGGGGGSGSFSIMVAPRILLPEILYISPGVSGANSMVCLDQTRNLSSALLVATSGSVGGTSASGTSGGTAGSGGVTGATRDSHQTIGVVTTTVGIGGSAGGTTSTPASPIVFNGFPFTGGSGGGGVTVTTGAAQAGGPITGPTGLVQNLLGGVAGANGNNGIMYRRPFVFLGGSGGGGNNTAQGATGGNGTFCCGGGGGGGGTTGGAGGIGGPGYCVIISF